MATEPFLVLDWEDKDAGRIISCERDFFWNYSMRSISVIHLIDIMKFYGLTDNPYIENHWHMMKIYVESCKEKNARKILDNKKKIENELS